MKKYQLHKEAMRLYKDQRNHYDVGVFASKLTFRLFSALMLTTLPRIINQLMLAWVHFKIEIWLILAYELVGKKEESIASYEKAGMWRECLNVAYSFIMPIPEIRQLATRLAESLVEHRQFMEAARLYVDYGTDDNAIEHAINALAKGYHFTEAIRVVSLSNTKVNSRSMINTDPKRLQH
jgi:hypothetical protein